MTSPSTGLVAPVPLVPDRLYALCNPYAVDGRVSWHTQDARAYASANCYLLREGDDALLIDTGLRVHERAMLRQLEACLGSTNHLGVFPLRVGEFDSIGNLFPIVNRFEADTILSAFDDPIGFADIRPRSGDGDLYERPDPRQVQIKVVRHMETLELGPREDRALEIFAAPVRLLTTHWVYDFATRTLFTSDFFTYVVQPTDEGPWISENEADAPPDVGYVADHLRQTRFWWLDDADVSHVRKALDDTFGRYDIERIAPAFGSVISGRQLVSKHFECVDAAIAQLGKDLPS